MSKPVALIFGISGQDGAYLTRLLLEKGYAVHGTSRDAEVTNFSNLTTLELRDKVTIHSAIPTDFHSVTQVIGQACPQEIYNLSGQSSVGLSFQQPVETLESIVKGTINILEAMRVSGPSIRLYNAASGEMFGEAAADGADESTPFQPRSPYAVAKAAAFWEVVNYRVGYGLHACSGILFNHESPLRPTRFVTRKICTAAARIAAGSGEKLVLGNLGIQRDWGWAPEYVAAMWAMLQQPIPEDFVIATGYCTSLVDFVSVAFETVGLDWRDHVYSDPALLRPSEISRGYGRPQKAAARLGWNASTTMPAVAVRMVSAEVMALKAPDQKNIPR